MKNIGKTSLVEQVTERLQEFIDSDRIAIGEKLPSEATICKELEVSRTTVREALRLLQALGYVRLIPNRGAFVADKQRRGAQTMRAWIFDHASEVEDVFEARMIIEPQAAALAAQRASASEKYILMGIHAMFVAETRKENLPGMILYDEKFHEAIMQACHNSLIEEVYKLISDTIRCYRGQSFAEDPGAQHAVESHEQIATAIMNGDGEAAERLMRAHLENNVRIIKHYGEARPADA